jgi:hypothetical protein
MSETRVVRVDEALVVAAESDGKVAGRSTSGQLSHWARIGRAVEASGVAASSIHSVLAKQADFDDLSDEDQATVAALWQQQVEERLRSLDMAQYHQAAGTPYAELDDEGNAVIVTPPAPGASLAAFDVSAIHAIERSLERAGVPPLSADHLKVLLAATRPIESDRLRAIIAAAANAAMTVSMGFATGAALSALESQTVAEPAPTPPSS